MQYSQKDSVNIITGFNKKALGRFLSVILVSVFMIFVLINISNSAQVTITPENNSREYPNLIIKNGNNLIANFSLIENSKTCLVDCYAIINVTSYISGALPNSFDFKDRKGNIKVMPFYTYFYNFTKYNITTTDYLTNCTNFTYYNITLSQNMTGTNCSKYNFTNISKTYVVGWQPYQGQSFQSGNHSLKLIGQKDANDNVDWGFSYNGFLGDDIRQYWAWWNTTWNNMKPITNITSDFVILYIPVASGKMNPDYSDLRFTDTLNTSELGYWIESYNTTMAIVRVNMNKNTSLNMWYGNKSAISSKSNIQDVYWTSVVDFWDMNNGTSNYLKLTNSSGGGTIAYSDGGRFGKFLDLSSNGYLEYADNSAWDFTSTGNFTILTYIKKPNTADSGIVSRGTSQPEMLYYTQTANGVVYIYDADQNTATTGTGIGTRLGVNTWQLLAITQSAPSNWTWWLNGTLIVNEGITMTYDNTNAVLHLGRAASRYLTGGMDDVLFLNKSLNPVEMKAIYNTSDSGYVFGAEQSQEVPSTPANITFNLQIPADISTINILNTILNISYNFTSGTSDWWNISSIKLYTKVNTSSSDCSGSFNGTPKCGFNGWGYVNPSGTLQTGSVNISYFSLDDNEVYPAIYNYPDHLYMETTSKLDYNVSNQNSATRSNFLNMSNSTLYNAVEINIRNMTATSNPAQMWYCNSSYVSGSVNTNANCVQIATITNTIVANHSHGSNSLHYIIPFTIINGKVSNVTYVTQSSAFIFRGNTGGWNVRYIVNKTRTNAGQVATTTFGGSWSELAGTFDIHFHQYTGTEKFYYYVTALNSTGSAFNSTESPGDLLNLGGIAPTSPVIYNPVNITYSGNLTINYTASSSVNGYSIMFYNISLYNNDSTFNRTIRSNNSNNLSFVWDVQNIASGNYMIGVYAVDNQSQSSIVGLSEVFTYHVLDGTDYPVFSSIGSPYSPANYSETATYLFNVSILNSNGTAFLEFNSKNYSMTNISNIYSSTIANFSVGYYSYRFISYGNSSFGQLNFSASSNFNITKGRPPLSISISPGSPVQNGTQTNVTGLGCSAQVSCDMTRNGTAVNISDVQTLPPGYYTYFFNSSASANFTSFNVTAYLNITDLIVTDYPQYSAISNPTSGQTYSGATIYNFKINWTDTGANKTFTAGLNFNGVVYNATNVSALYNVTFVGLIAGNYSFYWFANDSAGFYNSTSVSYLLINEYYAPSNLILTSSSQYYIPYTSNQTSVNLTQYKPGFNLSSYSPTNLVNKAKKDPKTIFFILACLGLLIVVLSVSFLGYDLYKRKKG